MLVAVDVAVSVVGTSGGEAVIGRDCEMGCAEEVEVSRTVSLTSVPLRKVMDMHGSSSLTSI